MKELFDLVKGYHKFHLELSYCSVCDWMLKIYRRGPYDDQEETVIFEDQCCDYEISYSQGTSGRKRLSDGKIRRILKLTNMTFKVIGTGSSGNCYLLCGLYETLVVEAGVKFIEVKKALNFDLSNIVGCVCSHEHLDHAKYVAEFKNAGIPVIGCENIHPSKVVEPGKGYKVGGFRIIPLSVDHDCPCFSYIINHDEMGKLVFITDTMTFNYDISDVNHLVIEANYDDDVLNQNVEDGLLVSFLRNRVVQSHMSLDTAIDTAKNLLNPHLYNLIYVHLSGGNSDVNTFIARTRRQIGMTPIIAKKGLCVDL